MMNKDNGIKDLSVELRKTWLEMDLIYGIIEAVGTETDIQRMAKVIVDKITHSLRTRLTLLMLIHNGYLELKVSAGIDAERIEECKIPVDEGLMGEVIKTKRPQISNLVIKTKDGQLSYPSSLCVPLMIQDRPIGVIATCDKLSGENFTQYDRRVLYRIGIVTANILENMRLTEEKAEERVRQEKETSEFLLDLVHSLTTPLSVIDWNSDQLLKERKSVDYGKIETISRYAKRADTLVKKLIKFAKAEEMVYYPVNINETIETSLSYLDLTKIKLSKNYDKDILKVKADVLFLGTVFTTILENGLEAMPDGGRLTISTALEDGFIKIVFKDTGTGIAEENKESILKEPFFTTKKDRAGLGLYTAKRVIEKLKGTIKINSKLGEGTSVIIRLPVIKEGEDEC